MKKIIIFFLMIFNLIYAEENKNYRSYLLGDQLGEIYIKENERKLYPLASVTKIMTLLVTYDAIENNEITPKDKVVIDKEILKINGSKIWMYEGQRITVEDLIKATAIHSANNAAYALAKYIGKGNVDIFIKRMKNKSIELGIEEEVEFFTPTGLPTSMTGKPMDKGSALGIYKLSLEALKYDSLIKLASQKEVSIYNGKQNLKNRNKIIGKEGVYGLKTGHHSKAGYNMSVLSENSGMDIVYVILGGKNEEERDYKILKDIRKFYNEYKKEIFLNENIVFDNLKIENGNKNNIDVYPEKSFSKIVKNGSQIKILLKYYPISFPIYKNSEVGHYKILLNNSIIDEGELLIKEKVIENKGKFKKM
ncbi:D-alanyl-D-alanine carboxypeptidase family protein [Fusobacterium perfoetens]|uniref:D-alanyl-D-alanine carboxypeptidase family protein n=1 Tax=Fusobacterium perfoetens TaxID=852 RepID=UPI0026F0C58E|nr:serine hydrolase [Fusobacterium perfoetens]